MEAYFGVKRYNLGRVNYSTLITWKTCRLFESNYLYV